MEWKQAGSRGCVAAQLNFKVCKRKSDITLSELTWRKPNLEFVYIENALRKPLIYIIFYNFYFITAAGPVGLFHSAVRRVGMDYAPAGQLTHAEMQLNGSTH
jgi:hypothetical protein